MQNKQTNKNKKGMTHIQEGGKSNYQATEMVCERAKMTDLTDKAFKAVIINMFK